MATRRQPKKPSLDDFIATLRRRFAGRLAPPLEGLAYRFTIWLPILARGKTVFSKEQRFLLNGLLLDCFGGCSQTSVAGIPPWSGSWLPEATHEPIVDHHIQLVVYALQDSEALNCLRQLKWALQQEQVAAQQVVLIELAPVELIEAERLE